MVLFELEQSSCPLQTAALQMCWDLTAMCCRQPEHCSNSLQASAASHTCWTPLWLVPSPGWQLSASRLQPQQKRASSCHMCSRYCNAHPCVVPSGQLPLRDAAAACCEASRVLHEGTECGNSHTCCGCIYRLQCCCIMYAAVLACAASPAAPSRAPVPEARPPPAHIATCVCQGRLCLASARQFLLSQPLMSCAVWLQGIMQVGVLFTQVTTVTLMLAAVQALEVRPTLGRSQCTWSRLNACAPASVQPNRCLWSSSSAGGTFPLLGDLLTAVAAFWNHTAHQRPRLSWAHAACRDGAWLHLIRLTCIWLV